MQERGGRTKRRRTFVAALLLTLGVLMVSVSAASASTLVSANALITFWNNNDVVTLNTPAMCPTTPQNPTGAPTCEFELFVNEPDIPAQTTVGSAVGGLSAILTVPYPTNFCGVLQADVEVGPAPWRLLYGHQSSIQTGNCSCGNSQSTSPAAPTSAATPAQAATTTTSASGSSTQTQVGVRAASHLPRHHGAGRAGHRARSPSHRLTNRTGDQVAGTTGAQPTTGTGTGTGTGAQTTATTTTAATTATTTPAATQTIAQTSTCTPMTGATQTVPTVSVPFTGSASDVPASTPTATLPFTGLDIRPLAIAGMVLILLGLGVLTTFEQKRNALRLAGRSTAWYSTRTARWFLGD
jgi:hypothetical protein